MSEAQQHCHNCDGSFFSENVEKETFGEKGIKNNN